MSRKILAGGALLAGLSLPPDALAAPKIQPTARPQPGVNEKKTVQPVKLTPVNVEGALGDPGELRTWRQSVPVYFEEVGPHDFRVDAVPKGVTKFRWELTFRGRTAPILSGEFAVQVQPGQNQPFTVDLHSLVPKAKKAGLSKPSIDKSKIQNPSKGPRGKAKPSSKAIDARTAKLMLRMTKSAAERIRLMPRVYDLRVTPLDASGTQRGLTSEPIRVVHGPKPITEPGEIYMDPAPAMNPPSFKLTLQTYSAPRFGKDDAENRWVITKADNPMGQKVGYAFRWDPTKPKSESAIDAVAGVVSDAVSLVRDAVNWASEAYDDAKKFALDVAVAALPGCSELPGCRGALSAGLDAGLAAVGLPPHIPNFDELVDMGEGYLAKVAAEQLAESIPAGALAEEYIEDATKKLIEETGQKMGDAFSHGGGTTDRWFKPDPAYQAASAYLLIDMDAGAKGSTGGMIEVTAPHYFHTMYVHVPAMDPNEKFRVPVVLDPDYDYYRGQYLRAHGGADVGSGHYRTMWADAVRSGNVTITVSGLGRAELKNQDADEDFRRVRRLPKL